MQANCWALAGFSRRCTTILQSCGGNGRVFQTYDWAVRGLSLPILELIVGHSLDFRRQNARV